MAIVLHTDGLLDAMRDLNAAGKLAPKIARSVIHENEPPRTAARNAAIGPAYNAV
jgi:hypothetical protein